MVAEVRVADHRESVKLLFGQKYGQELIDGRRRCRKLTIMVVGRTNGALAPDTRVKRRHPKISEPGQDVAMAVGYWRHSVAT